MSISRVALFAAVVAAAGTLGISLLLGRGAAAPVRQAPLAPVAQAAPAAGAAPAAFVAADQTPPAPTINVMGEGRVTTQPDLARMTLGVEVFNRSLAQAEQDASQRMNAVVNQLASMGIVKDDIQTVSFSVNPEYDFPQNGAPTLRGFRVNNLVSVKIHDVNRVGDIADAVINVGATTVQGLSFEVSNPQAAADQARTQAMQDARHKAEQLAAAAGVALGKPMSISESVSVPPTPVPLERGVAAPAAAPATAPPIQPGTTEIRITVNVAYSIQ